MKNIIVSLILLLFIINAGYSQLVIRDISGKPYRNNVDPDLQGSPFLFGDWRPAKIKLKNLGVFDDVKVKFSPFTNSFYYNQNDSLYEFPEGLEEVRIKDLKHSNESGYDMLFTKNVYTTDKIPGGTFVQVLANGKINLLKYYKGKIDERTESSTFGSEGKVKKMVTRSTVVAVTNSGTHNIEYNLKNIQLLTSDKEAAITNFIDKKDLNVKKEMDFAIVIAYYNLLSE